MERIERFLLYLVVLTLTAAVGLLAYLLINGDQEPNGPVVECVGCGLDETFTAALRDLRQGVVADVENGVGARIATHREETAAALDGVNKAVAKIAERLVGLDRRIAAAVSDGLLAAGCVRVPEDGCPIPPPPPQCPTPVECDDTSPTIKVESRFTFLYENARLNEEGKVTRESFGVRLAPRHLKRLELLTNALRPCHQPDAPVKFLVTGYASTAEFLVQPEAEPLSNSDALNLETANLRAQVIGDYLRHQAFEVEPKQWPAGQDLQRPYLDDGQAGMDQQALNRTVFVELTSAGACDSAR